MSTMRVTAAPRKYSEELKERATQLALDARRDPASKVGAIKPMADQLGIPLRRCYVGAASRGRWWHRAGN
jgi:transposase-like protein